MRLQRDLYLSNPKKPFCSGLGSRQLMLKFVPLQQNIQHSAHAQHEFF